MRPRCCSRRQRCLNTENTDTLRRAPAPQHRVTHPFVSRCVLSLCYLTLCAYPSTTAPPSTTAFILSLLPLYCCCPSYFCCPSLPLLLPWLPLLPSTAAPLLLLLRFYCRCPGCPSLCPLSLLLLRPLQSDYITHLRTRITAASCPCCCPPRPTVAAPYPPSRPTVPTLCTTSLTAPLCGTHCESAAARFAAFSVVLFTCRLHTPQLVVCDLLAAEQE